MYWAWLASELDSDRVVVVVKLVKQKLFIQVSQQNALK
jgi:hypothetical protein